MHYNSFEFMFIIIKIEIYDMKLNFIYYILLFMDVNTKLNYTAITTNNLDATVTIAILDTIEEVQEYVFWKQSPIMTTIVYDLRSTIYDDSNSIMLILVNKVEQFEKLCINDVQTMFSILDFIIEILDLNCSHLYNYEYFHDYILH